jgi:catechol 2,3-dioxygenase-like lactoylglutathione lyase family enzyme
VEDQILVELAARAGRYRGQGVRHGDVAYTAEMTLVSELDGRVVSLALIARDGEGTVFHREKALVSTDPDGRSAMWTVHTNADGLFHQRFRGESAGKSGERVFRFGIGDLDDASTLRTEIELELFPDGRLGHRRRVGVPCGALLERSRTVASPVLDIEVWHVAFPVSDIERSVGFYCGRLDFMLLGRDEYPSKKQAFVALRDGGFTLELFEPLGRWAEAPPKRPDHVAFECANLSVFRALVREPAEIETFDNGVQFLRLLDPDGVELHFFRGRSIYERVTLRPAVYSRDRLTRESRTAPDNSQLERGEDPELRG